MNVAIFTGIDFIILEATFDLPDVEQNDIREND